MAYDELKFRGLAQALERVKADKIDELRIAHPEVLGDNYEELVENLNRIAAAEVALVIVPPAMRGGG